MSPRRTLIERIVVAILSAAIALIFVMVTKPWQARLPHSHTPADHSSTSVSSGAGIPRT